MYTSEHVLALIVEAKRTQTREGGAVLDRHDLVEIIQRLAAALEEVADERDELLAEKCNLSGRLTRSSHVLLGAELSPDPSSSSNLFFGGGGTTGQ